MRANPKGNTMTTLINAKALTAVITAFKGEATAIAKARAAQDKAIQSVLDGLLVSCMVPKAEFMKGNSKSNDARREVKEMFDAIVETGAISKASGAMYQSAFWIAFEQGVEFKRDLCSKGKAKPQADGASTDTAKPKQVKVTSATRENLDAVLKQALAMARSLGLTEFAAEVLDICIESLDGFAE
jgi:hypothetical protein